MTTSSPLGGGSQEPTPPHVQHHPQQPGTPTTGPGTPKGLAVAALVAGIVAFLTGLLPVFGIIVGIAAVVLGILALRRRQPKALAVTGLALGAVGLVVSLLVTIGIGALIGSADDDEPLAVATATTEQEAPAPSSTPTDDDEAVTPTPTTSADPDVPADWAAALEDAEPRAVSLGSSKAVTYESLISGGATPEAAQYAVDTIGVDWQENATKKAKQYRDGGMPVETIHDQLTSEYGEAFTVEEADYAMAHLDD